MRVSVIMACRSPQIANLYGIHSSKGKGDRGKKPRRPVEIRRPPSLLCTGRRQPLSSDASDLRLEAGTVCGVTVAGSAVPSMLHESASPVEHTEIEAAFHLGLADSCNMLAPLSLLPSHRTQYQPQDAGLKRRWIAAACDRYIRAMGDGGSRPVSVARVAETPR